MGPPKKTANAEIVEMILLEESGKTVQRAKRRVDSKFPGLGVLFWEDKPRGPTWDSDYWCYRPKPVEPKVRYIVDVPLHGEYLFTSLGEAEEFMSRRAAGVLTRLVETPLRQTKGPV